jgi:hypothetical protein
MAMFCFDFALVQHVAPFCLHFALATGTTISCSLGRQYGTVLSLSTDVYGLAAILIDNVNKLIF